METGLAQTGRIRTTWGIRIPPILTLTAIRGAVRQLRRTIWAIPPRTTRTSMVIREAHPPHRQTIWATVILSSAVTIAIRLSGVGKNIPRVHASYLGKVKNNPLILPIPHLSKKYYVWDRRDRWDDFGK